MDATAVQVSRDCRTGCKRNAKLSLDAFDCNADPIAVPLVATRICQCVN